MICERFLTAQPEDAAISRIAPECKASLDWLKNYFGVNPPNKDNALTFIRDKTAFHYDKLNLAEATNQLGAQENTLYLAEHPANSVYYLGSALVFRTAFAMIADGAEVSAGKTYDERIREGMRITIEHASLANWHIHLVLYRLIETLLEDVLGQRITTLQQTRIDVRGAPDPDTVILPTFIDIGGERKH